MGYHGFIGGSIVRLILSFLAISLLGALALSGCNSAEQKQAKPSTVTATSPVAQSGWRAPRYRR